MFAIVYLLLLVTLVTTVFVVRGENIDFYKLMSHRDSFREPKNSHLSGAIVTNWVTQRLDNFDPTNDITWEQRYLMNGEYFKPGGCIFLFLGGRSEISTYLMEYSLMVEMSREYFCYMFYLEHRYYGQSRPTHDVSDKNLRFLTVDQALADTAHFVEYIKSAAVTPGAQNSPVIVIGSHYSASLAVWFRQSYPHVTIGCWASGAPTKSVVDLLTYMEIAGAVYRHIGGNACYERIENGFAEMEQMIAASQNDELAEIFQLCNELEDGHDITFFFSTISEFYAQWAQYEQIDFIEGVCNLILNDTVISDVEGVALPLVELLQGGCLAIDYESLIEFDRQTNWEDTNVTTGYRQWSYMCCTQLGWYHSSTSTFQPFGSSFPLEFMYQFCADIFEEMFSPELMHANSARFNTAFGGLTPRATNVLYVHGQFDPWRTVGVQTDDNIESTTIIIIEGASRSSDLGPITEADAPQLIAAKEEIKSTILRWIRESQGIIQNQL